MQTTTPAAGPPTLRVLLAPWVFILRPAQAAATMLAATPRSFHIVMLVHAALLATGVVALVLCNKMASYRWIPAALPANVTTVPTTFIPAPGDYVVEFRSFFEVWRDEHRGGALVGMPEILFTVIFGLSIIGLALLSLLNLALIHAGGSVVTSFTRGVRAVGASTAFVSVLVLGMLAFFVWIDVQQKSMGGRTVFFWLERIGIVLIPPAICAGLLWVGRAMRHTALTAESTVLPPLCEGCGYDLTHISADGRCSECGLPVAESLTPNHRRLGSAWENAGHVKAIGAWLDTTIAALFRPATHYASLTVRPRTAPTLRALTSFSVIHFCALGAGTALWSATVFLAMESRAKMFLGLDLTDLVLPLSVVPLVTLITTVVSRLNRYLWAAACAALITIAGLDIVAYSLLPDATWHHELIPLTLLPLFIIPLMAWLAMRLLSALFATLWFVQGYLTDPAAARRVLAYEVVFLWAPWLYSGLLVTSFIVYNDWITQHFGRRFIAGFPLEAVAFIMGNGLLIIAWTFRFIVAGRALRWANF